MPKSSIFVIVLGLALFVAVIAAAAPMGAQTETVTETFSPAVGASGVLLNESLVPNAFYDPYPIVLTNSSGIQKLTKEGTDYVWNNNGTIASVSGGMLDGVGSATITYKYSQQNKLTSAFTGTFAGVAGGLLPGLMLVVVVMGLWGVIRRVSG